MTKEIIGRRRRYKTLIAAGLGHINSVTIYARNGSPQCAATCCRLASDCFQEAATYYETYLKPKPKTAVAMTAADALETGKQAYAETVKDCS